MTKDTNKSDPSARLDPATVRRTLAGYKEVNRITAAERRARLRTLSDEGARAIFDDLCATAERLREDDGDWARLRHRRIEHKLQLRRAFKRLARVRGLL